MENFNTIPSAGTYGSAIALINANFSLTKEQLERLSYSREGFCGMYDTPISLNAAYPNPTTGSFAYVGTSFPMDVYTATNGVWAKTIEDGYSGGEIDLSQYADKASLTALTSRVTALENAGYMFIGIATPAGAPSPSQAKRFALAWAAGTYTYYGGFVLNSGEMAVLTYNGSTWSGTKTDIIAKGVVGGYDTTPTEDSEQPITSGGVYTAMDELRNDMEDKLSNVDMEFGSGEYVSDVIIHNSVAQNESALLTQGGITSFVFNEIDLNDIDNLNNIDYAYSPSQSQSKKTSYYTVVTFRGTSATQKVKVGTMVVISDGLAHMITEVMTTRYVLDASGNLTGEFSNNDVFTIYRSTSGNTWTQWHYVNESVWKEAISGIRADLTNYYTKSQTYSRTEVDNLIAAINQFEYIVTNTLPAPSANTMRRIYLIPSAHSVAQNIKDEYITIWDGNVYKWEQIGSTAVDLSGYSTTAEMNTAINAAIASALIPYYTKTQVDTLLDEKQDVIDDLSTIRSGAAAGATAVQPAAIADFATTDYVGEAIEDAIAAIPVDDEPTADSDNLVKSGGIVSYTKDNTLEETEITIADADVAGYIVDKDKSVLAKLMKNGAVEWLVENSRDAELKNLIKYCVHYTDFDSTGYVNHITDSQGHAVMSVTDNGEVEIHGGGGFLGERSTESRTGAYVKLITGNNGVAVAGIKHDGTVHIFKGEIDNLDNDNGSVSATTLARAIPMIAAGLDNMEISKDRRVVNLLVSANSEHPVDIEGVNIKSRLAPCISIIDDDTVDLQIPSSRGEVSPVSNRGGYFSVLLPFMLSLGAKHNKGIIPVGLACEGHRVGLTTYLQDNDNYTSLNENGNCVKWLHDNLGWNVFNHSMTAQLPMSNTFYVNGIDSELADQILSDPGAAYVGPLSFHNTIVLDRLTGKWYEVNSTKTAWVERTPTKKYAIPFYQDYVTRKWYFNRNFDFEYSWGEWNRRADALGLPYEKVIVHNGDTSSLYTASKGRAYANWSVRTQGVYNYPPIPATVSRVSDIKATSSNVRNADYENTLKGYVDETKTSHSWMVFMSHFNESPHHLNYYVDGVDYPDGDPNYPTDWIVPLTYDEIQDIVGENVHDYVNHPPSRLNISTWDEWYPAPGTQLKSLYDVLDYAMSQGVDIVAPMAGWATHGNMLNIGVDRNGQTYPYDSASSQTPYTDEEQSYLTIGADGSIRYFSK